MDDRGSEEPPASLPEAGEDSPGMPDAAAIEDMAAEVAAMLSRVRRLLIIVAVSLPLLLIGVLIVLLVAYKIVFRG